MLLLQVIQDEPRPPRRLNDRIPRDLETICLKAMAKEPAQRYPAASDSPPTCVVSAGRTTPARPVGQRENSGAGAAETRRSRPRPSPWCPDPGSRARPFRCVCPGRPARGGSSGDKGVAGPPESSGSGRRSGCGAGRRTGEPSANGRTEIITGPGPRSRRAGVRLAVVPPSVGTGPPEPGRGTKPPLPVGRCASSMPELLGACFHPGQVCDAGLSPPTAPAC